MAIPKISSYSYSKVLNDKFVNKAAWQVESSKAVLLIHDVQQYFMEFYNRTEEPYSTLVKNIQSLKLMCKSQGIPVVYTAQPAKQQAKDRALLTDFWGDGVQDEMVTKIIDPLTPEKEDSVFTKWRYSAFQRTPLHGYMKERGRSQLIICGVYAHIGILATALEAFMTDIQAFVIKDAVADFSEQDHLFAMKYIAGRCGYVTYMEALRRAFQIDSISESKINFMTPPVSLTLTGIKSDVAECLGIDVSELDEHDNLMDWGLDSIRLMALVEKWRRTKPSLAFEQLAEGATLSHWAEVLELQACAQ